MADVQPLQAIHYALDHVGGLPPVVAPPYDVIEGVMDCLQGLDVGHGSAEANNAPGRPVTRPRALLYRRKPKSVV